MSGRERQSVVRQTLAVLHGGPCSEHDVSVISAQEILKVLREDKHTVHPVWVDQRGRWHFGNIDAEAGQQVQSPLPLAEAMIRLASLELDCAFLGFHGTYGEDGRVQAILSMMEIPYSGSEMTASAIAMNKPLARRLLSAAGLKVPEAVEWQTEALDSPQALERATDTTVHTLGLPLVVKVAAGGSSIGVEIPTTRKEVNDALSRLSKQTSMLLCESFIEGVELTAGVLVDGDGKLEALPIIEIAPKGEGFFDFEAKYRPDLTDELIPARISKAEEARAREIGLIAHRTLGCRAVSRTDLILDSEGALWVLELNTLPGLTPASLLPKAAAAAGYDFSTLLQRIMAPSIRRR